MRISLLRFEGEKEFVETMNLLKVDKVGQKIMSGKGVFYVFKIDSIESLLCNVIKQEMLSLGGEVAVPREVITGKLKKCSCIITGTLLQYKKLIDKLKMQPWGLAKIAKEFSVILENIQKRRWIIKVGKFKLDLGEKTYIMGILNITPDSFSDGGKFYNNPRIAIEYALKMEEDGADIIDIGGESTRPGATPVDVKEELRRVIPVIKILSRRIKIPISIDTRKAKVAKEAIEVGASIVNDVSGLNFDKKMSQIIARYKVPVIIMHMKGTPQTMQKNPTYKDLFLEMIEYFKKSIWRAKDAGVSEDSIIIDPGIGFGKTVEHNLLILKNLYQFKVLGRPILIGTSRKSFIGKILNLEVGERLYGTIASSVLAVLNGANILRVHDVKKIKQAIDLVDAVKNVRQCLS